jgi:uncharacterized protein YecT (DUF1311 family)
MKRVVAALVLALLPLTALAGPKGESLKTVLACLAKAEESGGFGGTCIGIVVDPCIAAARSKSNYMTESKACAVRELNAWTELMQRAINEAGKGADAPIKAALAESQKSWAQSRERLCPLFDNLDPGVSLGGPDYCRLQETATRVLSLRRLANALAPH